MKTINGVFNGLLAAAAVVLLLPGLGQAQIKVNCVASKGGPQLASRLSAASSAKSRTLFVTGECIENVTVRNLRVTIDGQDSTTLTPFNTATPAITFTGGTTDATIRNIAITGASGGGILITDNAAVTVRNTQISAPGAAGVTVRRGGLATLSTNVITATTGLNIISQALATLGTGNNAVPSTTGIRCRAGSVVIGVKAGNVAGFGVNDGVPLLAGTNVTAGGNTSCFNDL